MSPVDAKDTIQISYMQGLQKAEEDLQRLILRARKYYKGEQIVFLTDRMRQYLNLTNKQAGQLDDFRLNIVQTIVMAVLDELSVNGFDTSEPTPADGGAKPLVQWSKLVWDYNRMALTQYKVTEAALRDSEAFVMVSYDVDDKMPRFTWHERLIDLKEAPTEPGVYMMYRNDDDSQEPIAAVKEWIETKLVERRLKSIRRRNIYYADHFEKWYLDNDWEHYIDGVGGWSYPWKDVTGQPIGIPVIPFCNFGGTPEPTEALPLQDALNKIMLDVLAEADGAFKLFFMAGGRPTTDGEPLQADGSNAVEIAPMTILSTMNAEGKMDAFEGGDPTKLMDTVKDIIMLAAQVTGTPVSYFVITKQIAGVDTLKGQDKPLTKKVEKRKEIFGQNWEDVMNMARKVANVFGNAQLDDTVQFYTQWKQVFDLDTIKMMREVLGIPKETLWRLYGLSEEQIVGIKATDEYRLTAIMLEMQEIQLKRMKGGIDLAQNSNSGA